MNYELRTQNSKVKRGFTLIEILVVISIIGILIASATPSWQNAQTRSRDGKRKVDAKAIQQALELYLQRNGQYPQASSGQIQCAANNVAWGTKFACTPPAGLSEIIYMQQLPKDPAYQTADDGYYYSSASPNLTYILSTKLENTNDPENTTNPDYVPGTLLCAPQTGRNWCVANP